MSDLLSAAAAKARLAYMLRNGNLLEIFGDKISGVPLESVLAMTQAQVWGGGALCDYPFLNSGRTRPG